MKNINFVGILGVIVGSLFLYMNIDGAGVEWQSYLRASIWPIVVILAAIATFFLPKKEK